jgi:Raf kinase inhibitor-like YbhB/YbcL family protein
VRSVNVLKDSPNLSEEDMSSKVLVPALLAAFAIPAIAAYAAAPATMRLTSTDVAEGTAIAMQQILNGFGCMGGNQSPELTWTGAPATTKSFALTVYDPDAPTGSGWWHWVVVDIPATMTELPKGWGKSGAVTPGGGARQTRTDFGASGYGGPCPPQGDKAHRYIFSVYALDIDKMPVPDDASGALVGFNIGAHTLAKGTLTAQYGR